MATTCKLIAKNVLGSDTASVTFSSIPATYDDLYLVCTARTSRNDTNDWLNLSLNGSSSNFSARTLYGTGSSAVSGTETQYVAYATANNSTANTFGSSEIYIPNYAGSTNKSYSSSAVNEGNITATIIIVAAGLWSNTAAITSIGLASANSGNLKTGSSFYLYGITKA